MKDYTKEELDKKIESFLTRKLQKYPDLTKHESRRSKRMLRERHTILSAFMPARLKVQF